MPNTDAKAIEVVYLKAEKKHSVRYDPSPEVPNPVSNGYYISKLILPNPYPKKITIEFTWD